MFEARPEVRATVLKNHSKVSRNEVLGSKADGKAGTNCKVQRLEQGRRVQDKGSSKADDARSKAGGF